MRRRMYETNKETIDTCRPLKSKQQPWWRLERWEELPKLTEMFPIRVNPELEDENIPWLLYDWRPRPLPRKALNTDFPSSPTPNTPQSQPERTTKNRKNPNITNNSNYNLFTKVTSTADFIQVHSSSRFADQRSDFGI